MYVKLGNPRHGPISADDAMLDAAHLAYAAQPGARLKLAALLKRLIEEDAKASPAAKKGTGT